MVAIDGQQIGNTAEISERKHGTISYGHNHISFNSIFDYSSSMLLLQMVGS